MKLAYRLIVSCVFALLPLGAHAQTPTSIQFGVNKAVSPWQVCAYDSSNTCQPFLYVPPTGGGPYIPPNAGGTGALSPTGFLFFNGSGAPTQYPVIAVPVGGTGDSAFTANAPLIGNGTSAIGQGTRSGSTTVFATTNGALTNGHCVSIDSSGNLVDAGGTCTVGGGGGTVSSGTANQLSYYQASGTTVVGLTTANNAVLVTNGTGVPSESATLPSGLTVPSPAVSSPTFSGTGTFPNNWLTIAALPQLSGDSVLCNATGTSATPSACTTLPTGLTAPSFTVTGTFTATGLVTGADLASGAATTNLGFTPLSPANNLSDLLSASTARTNLGLGSLATLNDATVGVGGLYGATLNAIPYGGGASALPSFVSPVNNAVMATNGSGVPSEVTTLPSGLTVPGFTLTSQITGSIASVLSGSSSGLQGISISQNASGSQTNSPGFYLNLLNTTSDTASITGVGGAGVFLVNLGAQTSLASSSIVGGREVFQASLFQTAATSSSNGNRNYVGGFFQALTSSGDNGGSGATGASGCIGSGPTYCGAWFGAGIAAIAQSGASYGLSLEGAELNWAMQSGASHFKYKIGVSVAPLTTDAVHADTGEAMMGLGAQSGAISQNCGICVVDWNGQVPFSSTSTVIGASWSGAQTFGSLIDFVTNGEGGTLTVSNYDIRMPNFSVTGTGNLILNAATGNDPIYALQINSVGQSQIYADATHPFVIQDLTQVGTPSVLAVSSGNIAIGESATTGIILESPLLNGTLLSWKNASGNHTACTAGGEIFVYSDNKMYIDECDTGTFVFRNTGGALFTMTPTLLTFTQGISALPSVSSGLGGYWNFQVADSYPAGSGNFADPFVVTDIMTNGGTGQRQSLTAQMYTGYGAASQFYVGMQAITESCGSGTDSSRSSFCVAQQGGGSGKFFGMSSVAQADVGTPSTAEVTSFEADVVARTAVARKTGIQIISGAADTAHATNTALEDALLIDGGGAGWTYAIYIGPNSPISSSTGVVLATGAFQYATGIDLSASTITGNAFKSPGFVVDHNGKLQANGEGLFGNSSLAGVAGSWQNTVGTCTFTPASSGSGTWSCSSDETMKRDIRPYTDREAINRIMSFDIASYNWRSNGGAGVSPIAQDVMIDHPDMVHMGDDGKYTLDQLGSWELVAAIQAVERKVERLEESRR